MFSFMEGVGDVVHDGQQFGWHVLLRHLLQDGQLRADNRTCFADLFIQSAGILCLDSCAPAHHGKEYGNYHNRLIKHQQHLVAYAEGPDPIEEGQEASSASS